MVNLETSAMLWLSCGYGVSSKLLGSLCIGEMMKMSNRSKSNQQNLKGRSQMWQSAFWDWQNCLRQATLGAKDSIRFMVSEVFYCGHWFPGCVSVWGGASWREGSQKAIKTRKKREGERETEGEKGRGGKGRERGREEEGDRRDNEKA